jgi:uncharacterized protein (TIGR02246 family)
MTELEDRLALQELVSRVVRCLDDHEYDGLRQLFTDDATISTPGGTSTGPEAIITQARLRHADYSATHHVMSDVLVDLDGDAAMVRANQQATLVGAGGTPSSQLGAVYRFAAARTADGWCFTSMEVAQVWRRDAA